MNKTIEYVIMVMAECDSNNRKSKSQDPEGRYSQGVSPSRQTDALSKPTERRKGEGWRGESGLRPGRSEYLS